ncbi:MAG: hypothetical protein V3V19_02915 [Cocleimonas sp.]
MIKITPKFLSIIFISALSGSSFATSDTSDINFSFTHTEYVNLTGTAVGASRYFSDNDVRPVGNGFGPKVSLGTLGLESNMPGSCTISFTSVNDFRLRHIISNKRLAGYRLFYRGKKVTRRRNEVVTPSCSVTPSVLELSTNKRFRRRVKSGIYQDIVTVTVTTE